MGGAGDGRRGHGDWPAGGRGRARWVGPACQLLGGGAGFWAAWAGRGETGHAERIKKRGGPGKSMGRRWVG
jgi:hypothetical protein